VNKEINNKKKKSRGASGRERVNEEGKEGRTWQCIFYICMNMEH
jgi:hypothetical protein